MKKLSFAFAALAAGIVCAQAPQAPAPLVGVATAGKGRNVEKRLCTGVVVSPQSVAVVPRVAAEILEVGFEEGGAVTNGQLLYRLDDVRYEAAVKAAEASILATKARLAYAEKNFERLSTLWKKNVSSKDEADAAEAERDALSATLHQQEADLIVAKDNLAYTRILSPIDGKIGRNNFTVGNYLTAASGTLATVLQVDPIRVRFALSNRDYQNLFGSEKTLKSDASVRVRLANGTEYPAEGTVEFVDNAASRSTDTMQIYAKIANPEGTLLPESTVTVQLLKRSADECVSIPPAATLHEADGAAVWVVEDGKAFKRKVVLGNSLPDAQFVLEGLKAGEQVVCEGTHKIMADGMAVQTREAAK